MTREFSPFAAFTHALNSLWHNRAYAISLSWPWMLISLPFQYARHLYADPVLGGIVPGAEPSPEQLDAFAYYMLPATIVTLVALASLAVNWHRFVLLDERATGWGKLRFGNNAFHYLLNMFLMWLLLAAVAILPVAVASLVALVSASLSTMLIFVIAFALMIMSLRFSMKLPAVAVGRRDYGFMQGVEDTAGHFFQLGTYLGLFVALILATVLLFSLVAMPLGDTAQFAVGFLIEWAVTMLSITILTSLYGFFVEGRNY